MEGFSQKMMELLEKEAQRNALLEGRFAQMREKYLAQHDRAALEAYRQGEGLDVHLCQVQAQAEERLETLVPQLAQAAGVTEALKAQDPMRWVSLMNTCQAQAEEMVLSELVYV